MPTKVTEDRASTVGRRSPAPDRAKSARRRATARVEESPGVRNLYTVAMMADVLPAPAAAVRHWLRGGLLTPARSSGSLQWFDFEQLVVGRRLARLLAAGLSLREIDAKLAGLARGGAAEAARAGDHIVADGRRLSIRRRGRLLGAGGQLQFDFYADGLHAPHEQHDQHDVVRPNRSQDGGAAVFGLRPPEPSTVTISLDIDGDRLARDRVDDAGDPDGDRAAISELLDLAADLEAAGELTEASEALRAVLQAQGPAAPVAFMLAELLYRAGDLTGARERYYNVIEIDEDHLEARSNLACVLAELGDHELALAALEGVLRQQPDYADAHWHMASVLRDVGRDADARRHLRAFLALAPESPWAVLARERLSRDERPADDDPPPPAFTTGPGRR